MSDSVLLPSLSFTLSVGKRQSDDDPFDDVIEYGGFPSKIGIDGIRKLEIFSNKAAPNYNAVITGYRATYDGVSDPVSRGLVNVDPVGTLDVYASEIVVGAFGTRKVQQNTPNDGRVSSIGFVLFDKATGFVRTAGPFQGTPEYQGQPWGSFGAIIALEGAAKDGVGLTTIGFVKNPDALPQAPYPGANCR